MLKPKGYNYPGQVVGIPMGRDCAQLVANLFLFCYKRDFIMSLSDDMQADIIDAFNTTSIYLNINNIYFDNIINVSNGAKIRN